MKQTILGKLKDQQVFRLTKNSKVSYTLQSKEKKSKKKPLPLCIYTSNTSGRTFERSQLNHCWVCK